MISIEGKIHGTSELQNSVRKSLARLLGDIAYESSQETRRQIPKNFHLKRSWVVQGIRFERPKTNFVAKVFSLDPLMIKHEEGLNFHSKSLVQARFLQRTGRRLSEKPASLLSRRSYFINDRGIFQRLSHDKLKSWYHPTSSRHYIKRLGLRETVERTAEAMLKNSHNYIDIQG